ncbi:MULTISPECIES: BglG family transcription antiterminator [Mammaliicoccus]|uniref:Transcription antiterminator n=3 Tax=Mammaliicoccus fleurettii TaxID=150056 RepID=A0ABS5MMA1_9STAP|nr:MULTISPECIES: BglG family transcription antiterminator [Mammaliicoccus]MBL0847244.1 transcription antiterminator [Mammaliicoccus fleurettii]MBS3672110.1 transcription antiterminator [Mammaliicoccus fleurettii]MBS3696994.1 transcription antiterminator [Mammaliicoccus fleurettii]MBW0763984.1 transcription antiterminator [Mammaliicoccus fleurettii]MEB6201704.1 BglG family transcription antiterminator [Mammaliicoccus fleurettii]
MLKSRPMNILNIFLNSKESVSAKELSIMFNKTERTIRNDLKDINEFLITNQFFEINNNSGLFILNLSNSERTKLKEIVSGEVEEQIYNPAYRKEYIISHALSDDSYKKIYELCEELQISKSTMDKDMKQVRMDLNKFNLKIVSNVSTGLSIEGNERDIRTFLYDYLVKKITEDKVTIDNLFDSYSPLIHYIDSKNIENIKDTYTKIISIEQNDIKLSAIILTAIWISRISHNHILATEKDDKRKQLSIINIFIDEVINWKALDVSLGEFNYINNRLDVLIGGKKQVTDDKHEALSQLISLKLIEYVEHELSIDFTGYQSYLFEGLNKHISGLISRLQQGIQIYNPLKENIKNSHNKFFNTIKKYSMNRLNRYIELDFTEDEIAFITVYFSTAYFKYVQQNKHYFNAVIVCSFGIATSNLLAEILKSHFNVNIIKILASNEEDFIKNDDVDIVFTTIDADFDKPTCYVNAIVNETDIKKIEAFLEQHAYLSRNNEKFKRNEVSLFKDLSIWLEDKGMKLNEQDYKDIKNLFEINNFNFNDKEVQPMLNEVLENHHVLLDETCSDWKNAIKMVSKPLLDDGIITSQYQDAMINSVEEYGPYIVIGKHIALAHARPEEGANALGVSIATLNPNIEFGNEINDPVKIIFCLSATDSFSHLNIMKSIVSLVRNEEKVDKLLSFKDKDEFINYLLEEELA